MATKKTTAKKAPASKAAKSVAAAQSPKKNKVTKAEAAAPEAESAEAKPAKSKATKPAKERKVSCIDAAAQVLSASKTPMNTKDMIEAIGAEGLWSSPGGKTPHATLYSAILREIQVKGKDARFTKTERGKFAAKK
jgi:hypothetical protein